MADSGKDVVPCSSSTENVSAPTGEYFSSDVTL